MAPNPDPEDSTPSPSPSSGSAAADSQSLEDGIDESSTDPVRDVSAGVSAADAGPHLPDPWARGGGFRLDGPLKPVSNDRAFGWMMAILAFGAAFIFWQLVSGVVGAVMIGVSGGAEALANPSDMETLIATFAREFMIANSAGQWLGFAAFALVLARLHARSITDFLRLRAPSLQTAGLSVLGMVTLLPVAQWLASINQRVPVPEFMEGLERQRMLLIEQVVAGEFSLAFTLFVVGITPSICEELIFRGYMQRQMERASGALVSIIASGVAFGCFHLSLTQVLPLTVIGLYLAYLTWRTGSIWPAVLAHFANNGTIVVVAYTMSSAEQANASLLEEASVPWYAALVGLLLFAGVLYLLRNRVDQEVPTRTA